MHGPDINPARRVARSTHRHLVRQRANYTPYTEICTRTGILSARAESWRTSARTPSLEWGGRNRLSSNSELLNWDGLGGFWTLTEAYMGGVVDSIWGPTR